jgi:DivIVA domain-containing protein
MGVDQTSLDRIRNATFPVARRGYDKHEVEKFLARLADWLETGGGDESRSDAVKRELERVGQRTGAILAQAEESAQQIRAEAEEEAREELRAQTAEAEKIRADADEYAGKVRGEAEEDARQKVEEAEAQARRVVDEGAQRREDIEAVISDLVGKRDEVLADTEELIARLSSVVGEHRPEDGHDHLDAPDELDPLPNDAETEGTAEVEDEAEPQAEELEDEPGDEPDESEAKTKKQPAKKRRKTQSKRRKVKA